jgi:predicted Zn-dependent protease
MKVMSPSRPRSLALAAALTLAVSAPAPGQNLNLPDMGSSADAVMTTVAEARLGKAFMRSVRQALPVADDPLITDYLEDLGNELLAADSGAGGRYTFFLIDEPVINAFAGPGGYIGIFAGLILACDSEDELAAVVAHEIAHVSQRHLMRSFEEQGRMSLPTTALMIAAAILGAQVSSDAGLAALAGVQAASIQRQINFTRENEKEADRIGIATLAGSGRDPYAMAGFFGRLSKANRANESSLPGYLRTHPVTTSRIADALGRADDFGARQRPGHLRFYLAQAKLREQSFNRPEKSLAAFRASIKQGRYRNETAEHYGYALSLLRSGLLDEAKSESRQLLAEHPSLAELIVLDARIDQRQGKGAQAVEHLRQAVDLSPGNWALRVAYADMLMETNQPKRAMSELEQVARLRPGNAMVYEMLTRAAIKSGDAGATHRYRAERLYAEGDLEPAIRQLEFALRQRGLPYHDAAQLQVLLEGMKEEYEEEQERDGLLGKR